MTNWLPERNWYCRQLAEALKLLRDVKRSGLSLLLEERIDEFLALHPESDDE